MMRRRGAFITSIWWFKLAATTQQKQMRDHSKRTHSGNKQAMGKLMETIKAHFRLQVSATLEQYVMDGRESRWATHIYRRLVSVINILGVLIFTILMCRGCCWGTVWENHWKVDDSASVPLCAGPKLYKGSPPHG